MSTGITRKLWEEKNREKNSKWQREYRQGNKERLTAQRQDWELENKEKRKKQRQEWDKINKERIRLQKQEYYKKNKAHIDARNTKYAKENREQTYEQQRKWREQKRLKNLAKRPKRILLKKNETRAYENLFNDLREQVIQRDGEKCVDCGMTRQQHIALYGVDITVDHENGIGSKSQTPDNRMENLRTRCLRCHGKKDVKRMKRK